MMDFFATDQPILNKEVESTSTDADDGLYVIIVLYHYKPVVIFDTLGSQKYHFPGCVKAVPSI